MAESETSKSKAAFIFGQVFAGLAVKWIGPEYDFDRESYKARIQSGDMLGRLLYISTNKLEDSNVSAEEIKSRLLEEIKQSALQK